MLWPILTFTEFSQGEDLCDPENCLDSHHNSAAGGFGQDLSETLTDSRFRVSPFSGYIAADIAYGLSEPRSEFGFTRDSPEINKTQITVNVSFEQKISDSWKIKLSGNAFYNSYYQNGNRSQYSQATLDAYESEVEMRDSYVEGPVQEHVWFKFGKQTIFWGEADFSQVLNLANPVDIREFGRTDINDALVPVTASKLVFTLNRWELDLVAIHEIKGDKIATDGSDFDPYSRLRGEGVTIQYPRKPSSNLDNTEYLLRIFKPLDYGDVSFIYADVFSNQANLLLDQTALDSGNISFFPDYDRYQVAGLSANYIRGAWLFISEFAYKKGVAVSRRDTFGQITEGNLFPETTSEHSVQEAVVGVTYAGPDNLVIAFESNFRHINDYRSFLAEADNSEMYTLMVTRNFMRERGRGHVLLSHIPASEGNSQIIRLGFDYNLSDSLNYNIGLILYDADRPSAYMYPYSRSDSLFAGLKYSF